jgi:hypothetical protein
MRFHQVPGSTIVIGIAHSYGPMIWEVLVDWENFQHDLF